MGDGGEENDSETSLEGVDAAGGSQACGDAVVKVMEELLNPITETDHQTSDCDCRFYEI